MASDKIRDVGDEPGAVFNSPRAKTQTKEAAIAILLVARFRPMVLNREEREKQARTSANTHFPTFPLRPSLRPSLNSAGGLLYR